MAWRVTSKQVSGIISVRYGMEAHLYAGHQAPLERLAATSFVLMHLLRHHSADVNEQHYPPLLFATPCPSHDTVTRSTLTSGLSAVRADEMLGTPKPKESFSATLKARSVLSHNHGRMHVRCGPLISLANATRGRIHRRIGALTPGSVDE